jgi:hypothetical protein
MLNKLLQHANGIHVCMQSFGYRNIYHQRLTYTVTKAQRKVAKVGRHQEVYVTDDHIVRCICNMSLPQMLPLLDKKI